MYYVGVDLHKHSISVCVIIQAATTREVTARRRFRCADVEAIHAFFEQLGPFQIVVEATASYEWFVRLVEPLSQRVVLAHPKKLRVIAESTKKTDKLDAQTLAEFLALDMIPPAWRPTPRVREHRTLVRLRYYTQRRITATKNKLRRVLADYNADIRPLFTQKGRRYLAQVELSDADRFHSEVLLEELDQQLVRRRRIDDVLSAFAQGGSIAEREARGVLASIPGVGPVTIDVVLSEIGDIRRFSSQRKATAFAGLAPGIRESAGRAKHLGITKEGSRLLRWALVQAAWRLVNRTRHWGFLYDKLKRRCGAKKAIVAVARRIWCVMVAMLKSGTEYHGAAKEALAGPC
jgi:transposase